VLWARRLRGGNGVTGIATGALTNVALDERSKDWRGLRPRLSFDSLASELGRYVAPNAFDP
jgi:hypothetical protein